MELTTGPADHTILFGVDLQYADYSDLGLEYTVDPIDIFDPVYGGPITLLSTYNDAEHKLGQAGVYLQEQLKIGRLTLVAGARHDWANTDTVERVAGIDSNQDDTAFTERVGLIYNFDVGLAPYASYATSFLPVVGTDAAGSPFEPETGKQYEIGLKYQPPGRNSFVTLSAFDLTKQNALTTDANDPRFSVQTGEIRSRGIEVEGVASFASGLDLAAAYAYIDAEVTESNDGFEGNTPYAVPRHRASIWADYTIPAGRFAGLGVGAGLRYVGETFGDDANSFAVPDYVVVDAAIHYERDRFRFALNATNLFDNNYLASCFYADTGCFYGEPLEVVARVAYRW